jgi:hypothetical protein
MSRGNFKKLNFFMSQRTWRSEEILLDHILHKVFLANVPWFQGILCIAKNQSNHRQAKYIPNVDGHIQAFFLS